MSILNGGFGVCLAPGALIDPAAIPADDLKPESVRGSADALTTSAGSIRSGADGVTASWSGLPAVYESPEAGTLYAGMVPVGTEGAAMAEKFESAATAVRAYADAMDGPKAQLAELKTQAEEFRKPIDELGGCVWMPWSGSGAANMAFANIGGGATTFAAPAQVRTPLQMAQDAGYEARSGTSGVEVLAPWRESSWHVERNNELVGLVNTEVAKVLDAEAACANAINGLRDSVCLAPVVAPTAEALASANAWGTVVKEDRNCGETTGAYVGGFFAAIPEAWDGIRGFVGYDKASDTYWNGEIASASWMGLATMAGLGLLTIYAPAAAVAVVVADPSVRNMVVESAKGLVAWDTWEKDPAEAAGRVTFTALTFLVPPVGAGGRAVTAAASSGLHGAEAAAGASTRAAAVAGAARPAASAASLLPARLEATGRLAWQQVVNDGRGASAALSSAAERLQARTGLGPIGVPELAGVGGHVPPGGGRATTWTDTGSGIRDVWRSDWEPTGRPSTGFAGSESSAAGNPWAGSPAAETRQPVIQDGMGTLAEGSIPKSALTLSPEEYAALRHPDISREAVFHASEHDALQSMLEARMSAAHERVRLTAEVDQLRDFFAQNGHEISKSDLTKDRYLGTISQLRNEIMSNPALTGVERGVQLDALDEMVDLIPQERSSLRLLVDASERLGDEAGRAVLDRMNASILVDGAGAPSGHIDMSGIVARDKSEGLIFGESVDDIGRPTIVILENKGGRSTLGPGRFLEDGSRARQGSTLYLNSVLKNDTSFMEAVIANEQLYEALQNGRVTISYKLVEAKPSGRVTVSDLRLNEDVLDFHTAWK